MINTNNIPKGFFDQINHLDLRSDLENNLIYDSELDFSGYTSILWEDEYEGGWKILLYWRGECVESYLYSSESEYNQDKTLIEQFK